MSQRQKRKRNNGSWPQGRPIKAWKDESSHWQPAHSAVDSETLEDGDWTADEPELRPAPPSAPPPERLLKAKAIAPRGPRPSSAPTIKPRPSSGPVHHSFPPSPYARERDDFCSSVYYSARPAPSPYARERDDPAFAKVKEQEPAKLAKQDAVPKPFRGPEAPGPWYGEGGKLVARTWECPESGKIIRYLAGRVAPYSEPECQDDEPVVLYLAGLGDAGNVDNPKMLRKRFNHIQNLNCRPFLFLVPFRPPGDWWCLEGDDATYGYLGKLVPEYLERLANMVEDRAESRKILGLGFSAGAYCLTELLAIGRPRFSAMAFGGLHGHGQPDLDGIPKARHEGVKEKYQDWITRIRDHQGVEGGIFAMHAEDDGWSPKRYAKPAFNALGARNAELGYPRLRFTALPSGKGHKYEEEANWSQDIFNDMFKSIGRGKSNLKLRGSIALALKEAPAADTVASSAEVASTPSIKGAVVRWIPEDDESDADQEQVAEADDDEFGENGLADHWSVSEPSDADENDLDDVLEADDEPRAIEEGDDGENEELQDANSAEFAAEDPEAPLEVDWREESNLNMDDFQVQVEDSCFDIPGEFPSWASQAAELYKQNGFVILLGALSERKAAKVLQDCRAIARKIVQPARPVGNRHGGARYSFGKASSTGSMLHLPSFAVNLLDNRAVLTLLKAISNVHAEATADDTDSNSRASRYKCVSAGGDFVLAGERRFQRMHNDLGWTSKAQNVSLPTPLIGANFCLQDITAENGPMRMVPQTQLKQGNWDGSPKEPAAWRASRLFPLPVGSVIVRDVRTLHAGSPNFSEGTRYLPSIEFASEDFLKTQRGRSYICHNSMPRALFNKLRPATKKYVHPDLIADAAVTATFGADKKKAEWKGK